MKQFAIILVSVISVTVLAEPIYRCGCYITARDGQAYTPHRHWTSFCFESADLDSISETASQLCAQEVEDAKHWASSLNQFSTYDTAIKNCTQVEASECGHKK